MFFRRVACFIAVIALTVIGFAQTAPYDIKGDVLGSSLYEFREKYRHIPAGEDQTAPFCESSPEGLARCQVYFPYEKRDHWVPPSSGIGVPAICDAVHETIANVRADLYYNFVDGKLFMINGSFSQSDFKTVEQAFIEKFGPPKSRTVEQFQNAFGAKFDGVTEGWENGVSSIILHERAGDLNSSEFTAVHLGLMLSAKDRIPKPKPAL